jgi:hypothetical protein
MSAESLRAFVRGHHLAEMRQQEERAASGDDEAELVLQIMETALREGTLLLDPGGVRERSTEAARSNWLRLREAWFR